MAPNPHARGATLVRVNYSKNNKDMKLEGERGGCGCGKDEGKMKGAKYDHMHVRNFQIININIAHFLKSHSAGVYWWKRETVYR